MCRLTRGIPLVVAVVVVVTVAAAAAAAAAASCSENKLCTKYRHFCNVLWKVY